MSRYNYGLGSTPNPSAFGLERLPPVNTAVLQLIILQLFLHWPSHALPGCCNCPGIPLPQLTKCLFLVRLDFVLQVGETMKEFANTE